MDFPPINGVDEGTFGYVYVCLASGWYGQMKYWEETKHNYFWTGIYLKKNMCLMWTLRIFMPLFALFGVYNVYMKRDTPHFKKLYEFKYAVSLYIFFPISAMTYYIAMVYSPTEIYKTHNRAMQLGHGL